MSIPTGMEDTGLTGLFGKLPAHGDFIHRNLPSTFINVWDEWLQHFISGSREQMGQEWLDIYLTSPIWRFVLSEGVVDQHAWAGILIPSVDKVGRYFPFSVVRKLPDQTNPLEFLSIQNDWFENVEEVVLQALQGEFEVDDLMTQINALQLNQNFEYRRAAYLNEKPTAVVNKVNDAQSPASAYANLLDAFLLHSIASYSFWSTQGSEHVTPCAFTSQGLPPVNGISAMLDGQWEQWNWQQPYTFNTL